MCRSQGCTWFMTCIGNQRSAKLVVFNAVSGINLSLDMDNLHTCNKLA